MNQDALVFSTALVKVNQFYIAQRLAFLTSELDDFKHMLLPEVHAEAMRCVQIMWQTVELLAGDLIDEIYDLTE